MFFHIFFLSFFIFLLKLTAPQIFFNEKKTLFRLPTQGFELRSNRGLSFGLLFLPLVYQTCVLRQTNNLYYLSSFLVVDTRSVGTTIAVSQNMQICHSLRCKQNR